MSDAPDPNRLNELSERIAAAKKLHEPKPKTLSTVGQAQHAWRMIIELVVGIGIGTGIGYGLDVLFGTMPWFLVPFTLLGLAAGVNVMLRTAKELQEDNVANAAKMNEGS
ncbi:ATP synthase F0 subunit I [Marinosulfonomonas sp. PRT-SC04]|nr:ATP synthase F0 subunit I [Marinosulfonomonas sp. PRT-SC04]